MVILHSPGAVFFGCQSVIWGLGRDFVCILVLGGIFCVCIFEIVFEGKEVFSCQIVIVKDSVGFTQGTIRYYAKNRG